MSRNTGCTTTLLAFDVGGSNCRAAAAQLADRQLEQHPQLPTSISTPVRSKSELETFIRGVVGRFAGDLPVGVAVAFAGPIADGSVQMTNWPAQDRVTIDDLAAWGLPVPGTVMVNDAEAGAYGLVRLLCADGVHSGAFCPLHLTESTAAPGAGSMVLLLPGTGLGCAGIVRRQDIEGEAGYLPAASEGGHIPVAPLDPEHGRMIEKLRGDLSGATPSWENFVSGPGLVNIYRQLNAEAPVAGRDLSRGRNAAAAIAEAAVAGSDPRSSRALEIYYRCVGRFAQTLALAYVARGGVFIAGGSTHRNRRFIESAPLVREFLANHEQRDLLETIPVYLVMEELNLAGGLALVARSIPHRAAGSSS